MPPQPLLQRFAPRPPPPPPQQPQWRWAGPQPPRGNGAGAQVVEGGHRLVDGDRVVGVGVLHVGQRTKRVEEVLRLHAPRDRSAIDVRQLRQSATVTGGDEKRMMKILPYL